jgi:putative ubiquitin-RnfH superfamily antitoxin RatB of RatAB toxin-antitoxin module
MDKRSSAQFLEVAYATPERQQVVRLPWKGPLTAKEAVIRSGLLDAFPEIGTRRLVLGIFGRRVAPDTLVAPGDRVEICRPLRRDPRDMRRVLAERGLVMGENTDEERSG